MGDGGIGYKLEGEDQARCKVMREEQDEKEWWYQTLIFGLYKASSLAEQSRWEKRGREGKGREVTCPR